MFNRQVIILLLVTPASAAGYHISIFSNMYTPYLAENGTARRPEVQLSIGQEEIVTL